MNQLLVVEQVQVLRVEPGKLVLIEDRICLRDALQREGVDKLLIVEHLLIRSGRPSEERQKIPQCLRNDALFLVSHYRSGAVTFAEARLVRTQDQRQVSKDGKRGSQGAVEQDLFWRIG